MSKIKLEFDKAITSLAGYPYGKSVYDEQCKDKINFDDKEIIIEFPDNIERIASSFTQGFFNEILKNIGLSGIEQKVKIVSKNRGLKDEILRRLF